MVKFLQRNSQKGFSLLEMLFVLNIISIFILLALPLQISSIERQQEKQFMNTLLSDILYSQNTALTKNEITQIIFSEDYYRVHFGNKSVKRRDFPANLKRSVRNIDVISFNQAGTIIQPGTIRLSNDQTTYQIVCPLGKGRCYINESS